MMDYFAENYNLAIVAGSFVAAVLGSFLALALAKQTFLRSRAIDRFWISLLAGVSLGGIGIWSMHFIGMLAYLDNTLGYNIPQTLLSLVIAIAAVTGGFWMVCQGRFNYLKLLLAGVIVGMGVVVMHYLGMAALTATLNYNMPLVYLSMVIAVVAATAALWLMVHVSGFMQMAIAAIVMGIAVCGMHYTGMAAVTIFSDSLGGQQTDTLILLAIVAVVDTCVLALAGMIGFVVFEHSQQINEQKQTEKMVANAESESQKKAA